MSSIYGGFEEIIYTSSAIGAGETATPVGITTRLNPILDPSNISIRGTGKRGLYDILLGMRQPQFTMDILPSDIDFISDYQDGQTEIPYLHYRNVTAGTGLTFTNVVFNRVSVESRHNEAINATIEAWSDGLTALATMGTWSTLTAVTPYRWLYSTLTIAATPETEWWSWRYEVNNNLQRLGNVSTGAIRDVKARHREVTGLIIKDLASFTEWTELMVVAPASEEAKFNITIQIDGDTGPGTGSTVDLLNQDACRWGRLEAPVGPEDLQAKRFPFLAIDLS
ncbi:MAG: hypothetical protein NWE88_00010 [Candidatus Bathyarchaeota archaeon]|nr:hypothetical protein [Candidatus Bathyarchaeota archaeon]